MIDNIIIFSVKNKLIIAIFTLLIVIYGSYSLTKLPIDAVPDVTNNQVLIITQNPNLAPLEIEKFITSPIELAMANLPGLVEVRSVSRFSLSNVTLVFKDEVDVYRARQLVMERLKELEKDMPPSLAQPTLAPLSTGLGEIYQYVLRPKNPDDTSYSLMDLRTIQDWIVRKKLLGTDGVADISSFGGFVKEYQAKVKPSLLRATDVSMQELFDALENGNENTGGAYLEKDGVAYLIRGIGLAQSIDDINNTIIKQNKGVPVFVKDVADVSFGHTVRYGAMTKDGKGEVVGAVVMMRKGENATKVVTNIKTKIHEINELLPDDLVIEAFIDREAFVTRAIKTVTKNLFEAFIIVVFVIMVFLGDIRASLLVASVIPLSMLITIILMNAFGVGGNLMSLGAIDFGLTVDPSIIVVENVVVALFLAAAKSGGKLYLSDKEDVIVRATGEIKKSVVFGGLIILVVYFPIMTLTGIEGKMFSPMAITVSFAISAAIILALTYIPMMCVFVLPVPHSAHHEGFSDKLMNLLYKGYEPMLRLAIRYKYAVVAISVIFLVYSMFLFTKLGGEFIPKLDEGTYNIETRMPVGTSLSESKVISLNLQKVLMTEHPDEIHNIVAKIGTSEIPTDLMPIEGFDMIISPKNEDSWTKVHSKASLTESIARIYDRFPGITYSILQPIENRFNDMLSGAKTDIVIKIFGDDLAKLTNTGDQIANVLRKLNGAADVQVQKITGLPQIVVKYDRRLLSYYGIQVSEVNRIVQTAFAGSKAGIIYEGERRFDLSVRLASEDRNSLEDLTNLLIATKSGALIPLKEISDIKVEKGPAEISRENGQRKLQVGFNVRGRDIESIVLEAQQKIKESVTLPAGYTLDYGGQFENLNRAKERLAIVIPISLLIIFALLFASFGTFGDSLLVYTGIPLSAIGGILALLFTGMNFSISAGVGFISLFGIAVLNGILLISHFNTLKNERDFKKLEVQVLDSIKYIRSREHIKSPELFLDKLTLYDVADEMSIHDETRIFKTVEERVIVGIKERFRQVLMTSAAAALGFFPMAVAHGAGAEVQKPLATVVIGGLITSTILALIVLPCLYIIFNDKRFKKNI
ncbi:MAG: CusA/CzcA family heavy metal efflux RND transporter [Cytophagales bacterium]|nr:CusA/CzcA family heavy metal efflux RND transporter [Cytophagales bacterium]